MLVPADVTSVTRAVCRHLDCPILAEVLRWADPAVSEGRQMLQDCEQVTGLRQ